ncbi:hypothetical protein CYMTET_17792 [Cymbomonas tetramitiformis]|uniref:Glucose-methanol-choline oxidoreductase N-terminal domain-containing protein n=1 Tax=Cymbomonas tetramitiformis TaxID=36881 RepID=A0AAE0G9Q0_9CHLO|nr:hypothetical protein CYMTET_17792 [Cymbomonas tetramitiformis]
MIASKILGLNARLTQGVRSNLRAFSVVVDSADYVVAGGGSAGCVLVNRLSEDVSSTVVLLEAGKSDRGKWDSWKIQMPSALTYNLHDNKYNWNFWTEPQAELQNRTVHQPRGKALGGSSSLNAMAYVRGHALDYERWATTDGATDWSYGACLPYFKKAQTHMYGCNEYRGGEGPLYVSREWHSNPLNDAFVQAGVQAGYPYAADMNGFQQEGFGNMDMTVGRNGERANTSNAYLRPAMSRDNVTVQTESVVTRILWSDESDGSKRAVGLEYQQGGETKQILANEEVILSLGAVGSPHVLMLSGVGDKQHLADHGIESQIDLPEVGQNLQDHLETYVQYSCTKPVSLLKYASWQQPWHKIMAGVQWFLQGKRAPSGQARTPCLLTRDWATFRAGAHLQGKRAPSGQARTFRATAHLAC